jgi:phage tail sheath gpL-like
MLVDLQGYWPGIETDNTSVQTLSGTPTLRYANGIGCKLYTVVSNTSGTGTNAISISYTNEIGTTGRSLAQTPYGLATSPNGVIYTSGSAAAANANTPSIFLPLAGGDTGVQNVASFSIDTADSVAGRLSLCIAKPLLTIPLSTRTNIVERDFVNQIPSLPRVVDGACLTWLYYAGAATVIDSNFYGTIEYVWG